MLAANAKSATNKLDPKWITLAFFIVANTTLVIGLRYCAVYSDPDKPFISSTLVLFTELTKLALSALVCYYFDANANLKSFLEILGRGYSEEGADVLQLIVPALLYTVQNNLQYIIESSQSFQVLYQLKLLTTALFYSALLSRRVSYREWLSILALAIGVGIVQSSQSEFHLHHVSNLVGIEAVVVACITSGFAGVYFEKIVKESRSSVWVLNIQLSFLCCGISAITCQVEDGEQLNSAGYLVGYNIYVVTVIMLQAATGLGIAMVVKFADNIHKGFATSISIIVSCVIDYFLFNDAKLNSSFAFGAVIVLLASTAFVVIVSGTGVQGSRGAAPLHGVAGVGLGVVGLMTSSLAAASAAHDKTLSHDEEEVQQRGIGRGRSRSRGGDEFELDNDVDDGELYSKKEKEKDRERGRLRTRPWLSSLPSFSRLPLLSIVGGIGAGPTLQGTGSWLSWKPKWHPQTISSNSSSTSTSVSSASNNTVPSSASHFNDENESDFGNGSTNTLLLQREFSVPIDNQNSRSFADDDAIEEVKKA